LFLLYNTSSSRKLKMKRVQQSLSHLFFCL